MTDADDRQRALNEIAAIARRHGLGGAEIAAALDPTEVRHDRHRRPVLVRVLGVLGGTFVFAGTGVFIATHWAGLNSSARVIVTLGTGVTALVLAVLAHRDARFRRSAPPLMVMAAVLEPTGMAVAFEEFGAG